MFAILFDVQCYNLSKVGIAVNESKVFKKAKMLFHVLQTFVEVEADYLVRNIVTACLRS